MRILRPIIHFNAWRETPRLQATRSSATNHFSQWNYLKHFSLTISSISMSLNSQGWFIHFHLTCHFFYRLASRPSKVPFTSYAHKPSSKHFNPHTKFDSDKILIKHAKSHLQEAHAVNNPHPSTDIKGQFPWYNNDIIMSSNCFSQLLSKSSYAYHPYLTLK